MYLICGEALFDIFVGDDQPAGGLSLVAKTGGSPFNVAIGLARLGCPSGFLAGLSRDMLGQRLYGVLRKEGVDTRYLVRSNRSTTLSLVCPTATGTPAYTFYGAGSADASLTVADLPQLPTDVAGLHFGSYSIVVSPTADALAALARRERERRLISLDPNIRPGVEPDMGIWRERVGALARSAAFIKVSEEDLGLLWPGEPIESAARRWLDGGVGLVVVTAGDQGARAFTDRHDVARAAAPSDVVDTVGAGDSFQAAILCGLSAMTVRSKDDLASLGRADLDRLLAYANRAAAITCGRRGADLPHAAELGPPLGAIL